MRVKIVDSHREFLLLENRWNRLPRHGPFLTWCWLEAWWRHLGNKDPSNRLFIAVVENQTGDIQGIAPWYRRISFRNGTEIRFLGDGAACSEYMGILAEAGLEAEIGGALAAWLDSDGCSQWDSLQLEKTDSQNLAFSVFIQSLQARGFSVDSLSKSSCWVLPLPLRWDDYLASRSKKHRLALQCLDRNNFGTGRAQHHWANTSEEAAEGVSHLIALHLRRRKTLGTSTTFNQPEFRDFVKETAARFFQDGRLWMHWITFDGKPMAALYDIKDGVRVYGYAIGIDPGALPRSPGKLILISTLKKAIKDGITHYDFLTGDESYKSHWRASVVYNSDFTVIGKKTTSRCRVRSRLLFKKIKGEAARLVQGPKKETD